MTSAVLAILAGGLSRRYQESNVEWQDKALSNFEGVPLLVKLIKRAKRYYDSICISVNSHDRKEDYSNVIHKFEPSLKPKFVIDRDNTENQGVLHGITSVLAEYQQDDVQFIPTDFPFIDFRILDYMKAKSGGVGLLYNSNGMIEPLLTLYGPSRYFPKQFQSLSLSRADVIIRISSHLNLYNIEQILEMNQMSPNVFSNINIQSDYNFVTDIYDKNESLIMPEAREVRRTKLSKLSISPETSDCVGFINSIIDEKQFYAAFLWSRYCFQNNIISSEEYQNLGKTALKEESKLWLGEGLLFLTLHALQDLVQYFPEEREREIENEISFLRKKLGIEPRKIK